MSEETPAKMNRKQYVKLHLKATKCRLPKSNKVLDGFIQGTNVPKKKIMV